MSSLRNLSALLLSPCLLLAACGSPNVSGGSLGISLGSSMVLAPQSGTAGTVTLTVSDDTGSSAPAAVSVSGVPAGTTDQITQPNASGAGSISFAASPTTPAGSYAVQVSCSAGLLTASQSLTLVVAEVTTVSTATDQSLGINGELKQFMSTSFQPADWDWQFFQNHQVPEPAQLNALGPQHIRLQAIAVPWIANTGAASDWNFTELDAIVQPVLSVTDHSPEFQIAIAPSFAPLPSPLTSNDPNLQLFVTYCQNLVRYYNKGGFTWGPSNTLFKSASTHPITWWGIFNEYNINGLTAADYVVLYNAVVPAMLSVDSSIKISAVELADFDSGNGDPRNKNLPTFVALPSAGGVNTQVNVASTHFYSSCNQKDTDTQVFSTIPSFANDVRYFRQEFALRPDLGDVAVWVTENNVNADYNKGNNISACNGTAFTADARGSSAFFAAWRPYVFSQLAQAGSQALYHWDYDADVQYGEVDYNTDSKYLSYWVDYALGQMFPVTTATNPVFLSWTTTETPSTASIESLATKNPDNSYVVMITNRAVNSPTDDNGPGAPRTVIVDLSALGNYTSVTQTTLNASTDVTNGPSPQSLTPAPKLTVTLPGYGTTFLHIQP